MRKLSRNEEMGHTLEGATHTFPDRLGVARDLIAQRKEEFRQKQPPIVSLIVNNKGKVVKVWNVEKVRFRKILTEKQILNLPDDALSKFKITESAKNKINIIREKHGLSTY